MKRYIFHPVAILLLLTAIFFSKEIFSGSVFYCCDNLLINIPSKLLLVKELRQGRFPLWNPYLFSGSPFLADINLALLYPLNILYFLLPAFVALTVGAVVNFMIALIGMYVFATSIKLSKFGALSAAVVFGFSGTMVVYTNNVPMLQVASLLPWVLWGIREYMLIPSRKTLVIAALLASMQVIAGHPQLTYYTWLLVGAFTIWELTRTVLVRKQGRTFMKGVTFLALLALLVLLIAAVQVLPFLEFVRLSTRGGRGFDYASFDSLHPLSIIRFIIPNIVGVLRDGTAWARGGSVYGFTGVISLLLAFFASRRNRYVRFFLLTAAASLLLALGSYTAVFGLAYYLVPGVAMFRSPQHFLLLYTFAIAVLAGFGLDGWKKSRKSNGLIGGIGIVWGIGGILLLLSAAKIPDLVAQFTLLFPVRVLEKLQGLSPETVVTIVRLIAQNLLIISGMLLAVVWLNKYKTLFVCLVFLELFLFSRNGLLSVPNKTATGWLTTVQEKALAYEDIDFRQYRLYTDPSLYAYKGKKQFGVFDWDMESAWQAEILRPNLGMVGYLPTIDGYASLVYRDYANYLNKKQADPTGVTLDDPTGKKKIRLGVLPQGLPRIFLLRYGKETIDGAVVEKYTANEVIVTVTTELPSRLVFVDTNYPGWEAFVDGEKAQIIPFEEVFKSVEISAGTHRVVFRFLPVSVRVGASVTLAGLGVCALLGFWAIRRSDVPNGGVMKSSRGRRTGEKRLKSRI